MTGHLRAEVKRLKRQRAELRRARRLAELALETRSSFLASLGHEIRTPMNGVLGMTDLLRETALSDEQKEYVDTIAVSAEATLSIINDLLDFSKLEAGMFRVFCEDCSAIRIAEDVAMLFQGAARDKGVELSCSVGGDVPPRMFVDPQRLRQVLTNLVSNAMKFTDEGQVGLRLSFDPSRGDRGTLLFEVTDTGTGIRTDQHQKVFEPYVQSESGRRAGNGTGLGLPISKRLVELMGGVMGCESAPGRGSRFWFTLPLRNALDGPAIPGGGLRPDAAVFQAKVLVAEDNPTHQKDLVHMFVKMGCQVDLAPDGADAVELLAREDYDLVLMDLHMRHVDGIEATERIRILQQGRARTPVIGMTDRAEVEGRDRCLAGGMDDFLAKPVRIDDLTRLLRKWLLQREGVS